MCVRGPGPRAGNLVEAYLTDTKVMGQRRYGQPPPNLSRERADHGNRLTEVDDGVSVELQSLEGQVVRVRRALQEGRGAE